MIDKKVQKLVITIFFKKEKMKTIFQFYG